MFHGLAIYALNAAMKLNTIMLLGLYTCMSIISYGQHVPKLATAMQVNVMYRYITI
jgi:hypothetical protein